jgi:hypothetical protein
MFNHFINNNVLLEKLKELLSTHKNQIIQKKKKKKPKQILKKIKSLKPKLSKVTPRYLAFPIPSGHVCITVVH